MTTYVFLNDWTEEEKKMNTWHPIPFVILIVKYIRTLIIFKITKFNDF